MFTRELAACALVLSLGGAGLVVSLMQPDSSAARDYAEHVACKTETSLVAVQHRKGVYKELVHASASGGHWKIACEESDLEYRPSGAAIEQMRGVTGSLDQGPLLRTFAACGARFAYRSQELIARGVVSDQGGHADFLTLLLDRCEGTATGNVALPVAAGLIHGDRLTFSQKLKEATLGGHVSFQSDRGRASSDTMHVMCDQKGDALIPRQITLRGNVQIQKGTQVALADQVVYRPDEGALCLTAARGELVTLIEDGVTRVQAETLVLDPKTGRAQGIGRVRFGLDTEETFRFKEALSLP